MLVFGFGISNDVNSLTFAVLDHDQSHECRAYLEELRGSSYFVETPLFANYYDLNAQLSDGTIDAAIEIPPGFGRDIESARDRPGSPHGSTVRGRSSDDPWVSRGHASRVPRRSLR